MKINLEEYFAKYRRNIAGIDQTFDSPFGIQKIIYADWTASGRLYSPIENLLHHHIGAFVGNTHTETTVTGSTMTMTYLLAKQLIKKHVGASCDDVIICAESGMTGVINKFQRILGLRIHEKFKSICKLSEENTPVIFVTSMEHHSNQTSWVETIADVEIIGIDNEGLPDLSHLDYLLNAYKNRKTKIAAITSCSNVTGIFTPYHEIAEVMHRHGGLCFVDFAASAPYININMHPQKSNQKLDAIFFSPHKFLGGPGTSGVLVFDSKLYNNRVPDNPGGGTVDWTNPWGQHKYIDNIEQREDGGTPPFLQTIKVALCIKLKEQMGVNNIFTREKELMLLLWQGLSDLTNLHILADNVKDRLPIFSFYIDDLHYNLGVKLLNDRFGIQVRGGCSCAGTYGHFLLHVTPDLSRSITEKINKGDLSAKPGWIRLSLHPIMTNDEVRLIIKAIKELAANHLDWSKDYKYCPETNEFNYRFGNDSTESTIQSWYETELI